MTKEVTTFSKFLIVIGIIAFFNLVYCLFELKKKNLINGFAIKEDLYTSFDSLPKNSRIFLFVEWAIILFIFIFILTKEKIYLLKKKDPIQKENLNLHLNKTHTDLDAFYGVLKVKKEMSLSSITQLFNITPSLAMEWGRILESGDLAQIDNNDDEPIIRIIIK